MISYRPVWRNYDVVVVGARCAGSPLATLLAREGVRVALVEQARFPRDTLSSHLFQADGLAFLDRLGLTERLRSTGAPFANRTDTRIGDVRLLVDWPRRPGDPGGITSIRRTVLDPILAEAAEEAGPRSASRPRSPDCSSKAVGWQACARTPVSCPRAWWWEPTAAVRPLRRSAGRAGTTSRRTGALYWGFYEGVAAGEPTFVSHRWADRFILGIPSDGGLYQVLVWPEFSDLERFDGDLEGCFADLAGSCEPDWRRG